MMIEDNNQPDSQQALTWRLANLQLEVPFQFHGHQTTPRNVTSMARGFLPGMSQRAVRPGGPSTGQNSSSVITEPSTVINMPFLNPLYSQAGQVNSGPHLGISHLQGENNNHPHAGGHGHSHNAGGVNELQQDWQPLLQWLQKSGVFFVLLFIKFIYDHRLGFFVFLGLGGTFAYMDKIAVQYIHQVAARERSARCSLPPPVYVAIFLCANITIIYYVFADQVLWNALIMRMPQVSEVDVWTLLWVVLLTDYIIKFVTVMVKGFVSLIPHRCLPNRRRGKYFMFLEHVSQFYRNLVPIIPWIHFLSDDQQTGKWFATILLVIYMIFKMILLWVMAKDLWKVFRRLRVHTAFGTKPSCEDLKIHGEQCPICQDDCKDPVMLTCKHIFCEDCVSLWFDREKTCPMCRAQITENPCFQDGSTSSHLQLY